MKYKELDLVSLFIYLLLHWRSIIIAALICALLALGFDVVGTLFNGGQMNEDTVVSTQSSAKDIDAVLVYAGSVMDYNDMNAVLADSAYMALDGKNVARTEVVIVVKGNGGNRTAAIADIYRDYADGLEVADYVCEADGITATCVDELINVKTAENDTVKVISYDDLDSEETIFLEILGNDEAVSNRTADLVIEYLGNKKDDIVSKVGDHELIVVSRSTSTGADTSVIKKQREYSESLLGLYDTMLDREKNLTAEQRKAYESLKNNDFVWGTDQASENETVVDNTVVPKTAQLRINKKLILIGFAVGAFYMAFIWALVYVLGNRIKIDDKYEKLWDVSIMGIIPDENKKKKLMGFVDGWIISLRDRDRRRFSAEETISQIISKVKIQSTKDKVSNLVFIGCDLERNVPEIPSVMAGKLGEADINAIVLDNILYNPENTEKLGGMDGAVIVEKVGKTRYSELTEEIEILKRQQIKLLGMVIVE